MRKRRTLAEFETAHGESKIKDLKRQVQVERAKVEALAGVQNQVSVEKSRDNFVRFAVTGDRHTGSLYQNAAALHGFYEHCEIEGVELVIDCGDILAGHKVYRGQEFELGDLGFEAQLARMVNDSPRNIRTKFITGNHDASFKNAVGLPVGKMIQDELSEYEFIGEDHARIQFETPNGLLTVGLLHPAGGTAYALSYKSQKIVESLEGGTKPDLLCIGHFHKSEFIPSYRNVAVLQSGTFEKQTPFMARQGLAAHVGGWIIEVWVGEGHKRIRGEFVAFYE